ncbi:hypothetical protein ACWKT5_29835 [Streptomyces avermitilis]
MTKRVRVAALTALTAAGLVLGTAVAGPAGAAVRGGGSPAFLSAAELPPHPTSSWTAGKVTDGVPDELRLCLDAALPGDDSRYRAYRTDLDTSARQLTMVLGDEATAKGRTARLNEDIRSCATRIERPYPETDAVLKDYGTLPVEEGAHVYGLHTATSWGASDIHLFSVGRDGRAVTVVEWAQLGDFTDAPVTAFKKTTTTAVNKLY